MKIININLSNELIKELESTFEELESYFLDFKDKSKFLEIKLYNEDKNSILSKIESANFEANNLYAIFSENKSKVYFGTSLNIKKRIKEHIHNCADSVYSKLDFFSKQEKVFVKFANIEPHFMRFYFEHKLINNENWSNFTVLNRRKN